MRNCMIHDGGRANDTLAASVANWTPETERQWVKVAPSLRGIKAGDRIQFGHEQLILALAVTKFLSREANMLIQRVIPRDVWADVVIEDASNEERARPNPAERLRKIRGVARFHYAPLQLSEPELAAALEREERSKRRGSSY